MEWKLKTACTCTALFEARPCSHSGKSQHVLFRLAQHGARLERRFLDILQLVLRGMDGHSEEIGQQVHGRDSGGVFDSGLQRGVKGKDELGIETRAQLRASRQRHKVRHAQQAVVPRLIAVPPPESHLHDACKAHGGIERRQTRVVLGRAFRAFGHVVELRILVHPLHFDPLPHNQHSQSRRYSAHARVAAEPRSSVESRITTLMTTYMSTTASVTYTEQKRTMSPQSNDNDIARNACDF